jgi:hypothetical protein
MIQAKAGPLNSTIKIEKSWPVGYVYSVINTNFELSRKREPSCIAIGKAWWVYQSCFVPRPLFRRTKDVGFGWSTNMFYTY